MEKKKLSELVGRNSNLKDLDVLLKNPFEPDLEGMVNAVLFVGENERKKSNSQHDFSVEGTVYLSYLANKVKENNFPESDFNFLRDFISKYQKFYEIRSKYEDLPIEEKVESIDRTKNEANLVKIPLKFYSECGESMKELEKIVDNGVGTKKEYSQLNLEHSGISFEKYNVDLPHYWFNSMASMWTLIDRPD